MNAGCAGKTVRSLRTRTIPERLRDVFITRSYTNQRLPYLTLPEHCEGERALFSLRHVVSPLSLWSV